MNQDKLEYAGNLDCSLDNSTSSLKTSMEQIHDGQENWSVGFESKEIASVESVDKNELNRESETQDNTSLIDSSTNFKSAVSFGVSFHLPVAISEELQSAPMKMDQTVLIDIRSIVYPLQKWSDPRSMFIDTKNRTTMDTKPPFEVHRIFPRFLQI